MVLPSVPMQNSWLLKMAAKIGRPEILFYRRAQKNQKRVLTMTSLCRLITIFIVLPVRLTGFFILLQKPVIFFVPTTVDILGRNCHHHMRVLSLVSSLCKMMLCWPMACVDISFVPLTEVRAGSQLIPGPRFY